MAADAFIPNFLLLGNSSPFRFSRSIDCVSAMGDEAARQGKHLWRGAKRCCPEDNRGEAVSPAEVGWWH